MEATKVCKYCNQEKPIAKFTYGARFTRVSICNDCQYAQQKEREKKKGNMFWLEDWIYKADKI